jgi:hypothetical protein
VSSLGLVSKDGVCESSWGWQIPSCVRVSGTNGLSCQKQCPSVYPAVEKHILPLAEVTTPSLEALKAYRTTWKVLSSTGGRIPTGSRLRRAERKHQTQDCQSELPHALPTLRFPSLNRRKRNMRSCNDSHLGLGGPHSLRSDAGAHPRTWG